MHFNSITAITAESKERRRKNMSEIKRNEKKNNVNVKGLLLQKENGDSQLVVSIIMIIIALILCFMFKDSIVTFMNTAFTSLTGKLNTLLGTI